MDDIKVGDKWHNRYTRSTLEVIGIDDLLVETKTTLPDGVSWTEHGSSQDFFSGVVHSPLWWKVPGPDDPIVYRSLSFDFGPPAEAATKDKESFSCVYDNPLTPAHEEELYRKKRDAIFAKMMGGNDHA